MANLNVAILEAQDFVKDPGKERVRRSYLEQPDKCQDTVTFIEPAGNPERLAPLLYAIPISQTGHC
jgi:hypothetical protein